MPRKVALFITCLTDQFFPQVGVAITKILEHYGCEVEFPQSQTCCGQPFFNNGFHPEARKLAERWVEIFEPYDAVITPSGSCASMVRAHYHEVFEHDAAFLDRSKRIAGRTYEFVEFLHKVLNIDASKLSLARSEPITYHYVCHLRGLGIKDEGVRFLQQIGNVDFRAWKRPTSAAGSAGLSR